MKISSVLECEVWFLVVNVETHSLKDIFNL